jgi:iron complex transport system permease protein
MHRRRALGLLVIAVTLVLAVIASLTFGANRLGPGEVWHGLWHRDRSEASAVVWDLRIPRTVVGVVVGAAFGVAGALIQALTRNPLADPGLLGVNAGAGFAVTVGVGLTGGTAIGGYIWFAFVGAALATVLVYVIGSAGGRGTASPVTLVLAGVAMAAVLGGISGFLTLIDPLTFERLRFWGLGTIARTTLDDLWAVLPFLAAGLVLALGLAPALNSISLGDDLASSLGTHIGRTRVLGVVAVTLLAGGGTALTGGIAFVGLMVPHTVRWFTGPDQRWILAYTAIVAPTVVLLADVVGRVVGRPGEIEVGLVVSVIGAPVLIALVRRARVSGL